MNIELNLMNKRIHILTVVLSLFLLTSFSGFHDYYVSVTKVEYIKEEKSLQIISQIFIDDFEKVIQERYDESIVLGENNESDIIESYMGKYLTAKLDIKVNSKDYSFHFLGKEYKEDIVYCYLEIKNIEDIKNLEIKNQVLFDMYVQQQNILRTKIKGKNKSFILIQGKDKAVLNFE